MRFLARDVCGTFSYFQNTEAFVLTCFIAIGVCVTVLAAFAMHRTPTPPRTGGWAMPPKDLNLEGGDPLSQAYIAGYISSINDSLRYAVLTEKYNDKEL